MLSQSLPNPIDAYRAALQSSSRTHLEYTRALSAAHARPKINLESLYLASIDAQAREARAFKRLMQVG